MFYEYLNMEFIIFIENFTIFKFSLKIFNLLYRFFLL